jgi:hypothetical protein
MVDEIEGLEVAISGRRWIIPPLNLRRVRKLEPLLGRLIAGNSIAELSEDSLSATAEIVHLALTRNYPDLSITDVENLLDLRNFREVLDAVMKQSGLLPKVDALKVKGEEGPVDWDALYAHLLACFPGWTWEYIDEQMTIPRLEAITAYQREFPPQHVLIAAYLGAGKKAKTSEFTEDGQSVFDVFPRTPGK